MLEFIVLHTACTVVITVGILGVSLLAFAVASVSLPPANLAKQDRAVAGLWEKLAMQCCAVSQASAAIAWALHWASS